MERLRTLGLYVAADAALMARLARVLRFVLHCHLPSAADNSNAAAELAKVCNRHRRCMRNRHCLACVEVLAPTFVGDALIYGRTSSEQGACCHACC